MTGGVTQVPLRAVVADDERHARTGLRLALEAAGQVEVVGECSGGDEAIRTIRSESPHVAFLDISMPETDGFDVVRALGPGELPHVVFVTAHGDRALDAFEVEALDYVLKPFDDERIARVVDRVRGSVGVGAPIHRFLVREPDRAFFVRAEEVDWIEASGKYVTLHAGPRAFRVRATVSRIAEGLDPACFARVHRSHIVNLDRVVELHPWFGGDYVAVLDSGAKVRVSRTYRSRLLRTLS